MTGKVEDITRWQENMNLMFEWQEGVIFFLLYGQQIYLVEFEKQALIQILGINSNT